MDKRRDIARDLARRYGVLSTESLDQLTDIIIPMKVTKGTKILKEGELCKHIYYIERGLVRQVYTKNGKELTEHIGYEGGIIMCIESLFNGKPSYLTVEALEPSLLYAIPYDEYMRLARNKFEFCNILLAILQESLIVSQRKADTLRLSRTLSPRLLLTTP